MEVRILFSRDVSNLQTWNRSKIIRTIQFYRLLTRDECNEKYSPLRAKFENAKLAFDDLTFSQLALIDRGTKGEERWIRETLTGRETKEKLGQTENKPKPGFTRPSTFLAKT